MPTITTVRVTLSEEVVRDIEAIAHHAGWDQAAGFMGGLEAHVETILAAGIDELIVGVPGTELSEDGSRHARPLRVVDE